LINDVWLVAILVCFGRLENQYKYVTFTVEF